MTTTNNHLTLIDQVGGIEKAREIVSGAPEGATHFSKGHYYIRTTGDLKMWDERWFNIEPHKSRRLKCLKNLRTAIAKHDEDHCNHEWNDTTSNGDKYRSLVCKNCDSTKNYLPLDEDHITNIHNHISPNMKVVEL